MKTVFMGTPDFAARSLESLLKAEIKPVLVVTKPDKKRGRGQSMQPTPVKILAEAAGLPVATPDSVNTPQFLEQLRSLMPDLIIVVAFGQLIKKELLNLPPQGIVNVHASLLPKYRGAAPIHRAILNGETKSGVTTMLIDEGMDTGEMIFKAFTAITPDMTTGELHDILAELGGELLVKTVCAIEAGNCPHTPQNHEQATYAARLNREEELLAWHKTAQELHNQIRGLSPFPGAYTLLEGKRLKVFHSEIAEQSAVGRQAGEIISIDNGLVVQTGLGAVRLLTVQPEGKKPLSAADYLRGAKLQKGTILG